MFFFNNFLNIFFQKADSRTGGNRLKSLFTFTNILMLITKWCKLYTKIRFSNAFILSHLFLKIIFKLNLFNFSKWNAVKKRDV